MGLTLLEDWGKKCRLKMLKAEERRGLDLERKEGGPRKIWLGKASLSPIPDLNEVLLNRQRRSILLSD